MTELQPAANKSNTIQGVKAAPQLRSSLPPIRAPWEVFLQLRLAACVKVKATQNETLWGVTRIKVPTHDDVASIN